jgi:hypothetical protein
LAEQLAKLLKTGCLDAESIAEVKPRIASCPSTTLPVRDKVAEAAPLAPHPLPPPENNDEEGKQSSPPRCRQYYTSEYSEDNRPELEVRETRPDVGPSDSHIILVMKENKQPMDKPKVFSG